MPFATAFRTDSALAPSPTPAASRLPCPWRPRESETSSRSRLHAAPSALRLLAAPTRSLRPAPIRHHRGFGSGRERPSPCIGSHRSLRPALTLDPRLREARHATPKCQWTDDDDGSGSEEPAPNRNTHGFATRFASHLCSLQRSGASALPPTVTRCDRWLETTFEEACRPCSARRREASCRDVRPDTVQGTHSARPHPKTETFGGARPTTGWTTASMPAHFPPRRAARRCHHLRAVCASNRLTTRSSPETTTSSSSPKATFANAIPREELTPDDHLAVIPRHPSCRALRKCKHPAECAARGRPPPTLPPIAIGSKRDQWQSETHKREPIRRPTIRVRRRRTVADGRTRSAGSSCRPISGSARDVAHSESDARSKRPLGTHRLLERTLAAFHGVLHPTTLTEAGSDLHRVCLTRLCSAYRLSQPLDALLRLRLFRPCFMPVAPMGFHFQRLSPPGSGLRFSPQPSPHAVVDDWVRRLPGRLLTQPRLRGFAHPGDPYRQAGLTRFLPADPLIAFTSPRYTPTRPWPRASTKPPLMGFYIAPDGCPPIAMLTLQSIKEPRGGCISFEIHQPP
jgi:hypothetical protein